MMEQKKILILGAGYAGIHAAKKLAKHYKKEPNVTITLIDKNPFHTLLTELHEVAGSRVHPESVQVNLNRIFARTKVNLVTDFIENVDTQAKIVKTKLGEYTYDYLIICLGSEPAFFGVPGIKEHGFTLWSFEDSVRLRHHIKDKFEEASKELDKNKRMELLTFVVAGSGFTGIEMAGELGEVKHRFAKEFNIDPTEVKVMVVEALGTILNMLDRQQALKAEKYMINKLGIELLKDSPITEVTSEGITLKAGRKIATKTLIWTCGIQACNSSKEYKLEMGRAGRLRTNQYMESVNGKDVYIAGDLTCYEEKEGALTPQIVEAAEQTGATAALNIIADIENKAKVPFKSNYHGFMVSIGGKYCVANLMGVRMSGFIAMVMKHMVNLYYLFLIGGLVGCIQLFYNYLNHEFFSMEDERSIMRGHLSSKGNRLWLVALRVYVGFMWVFEALAKLYGEATWKEATSSIKNYKLLLNGIGPDSWMKAGNIKMPFEWLYAADATTAASATASTAAAGAAAWPDPILTKMPGFFEWIMKILIPNADISVWFQRIVVLMELGIGLCLIVGLFTFLASAVSAFLTVNFVLSAMAGWSIAWYFFCAIALMSGAGRTFGLDYYVMPAISKGIHRFWYGKDKSMYVYEGKK